MQSQTPEFNLKKYWYLRWRLKNYFMVVGEGPGKSIPAGIREKYFDDTKNGGPNYYSTALDFGDAPNYLAHYIGVLATEYQLLSSNNQSTAKTVEELYYALKAIIRMDNCEGEYPWSYTNILDGRCSRNSTPKTFVQDNYNSLNKNLEWFSPIISNFGDLDSANKVQIATSIGMNGYPDKPDKDKEGGMMSQDHISSMLVAMALIKKFVPNGVGYNGLNLHQEAKNISNRFIDYMKGWGWYLRDPDGNQIPAKWGSIAGPYAYGFAKAAHFIDNSNNTYYTNSIALASIPDWTYIAIAPHPLNSGSTWIYLNLAAVGDSWNQLPSNACSGIPFGMNCTQVHIWKHSMFYDWEAYYPLLHAVLHNMKCKTSNNKILADLDDMPCSGHWHLDANNKSNGWATSHKYHSIKHDNDHGDVGFEGKYNALEYMLLFNLYCIYKPNYVNNYYPILAEDAVVSGNVPYMLPFPLPPSYLVAVGAENNQWPAFYGIPQVIHSFRSLQSTAVIENKNMSGTYQTKNIQGNTIIVTINMQGNAQANVTYKAGEGITLKPGFHAKTGVTFHAYIDPLTCNNNGSNYERYGEFSDEEEDDENETISQIPKTENLFSISPNPANGQFQVNYTALSNEEVYIELMDVTGHILQRWQKTGEAGKIVQCEMDVRSLLPGVYMLRLVEGAELKTAKVVIQY